MNIEEIKNNIGKRKIESRVWDTETRQIYAFMKKEVQAEDGTQFVFDAIFISSGFNKELFSLSQCLNSKRFIVMQYTGLKDKNGKRIFEGDIVTTRTGGGGALCDGIVFYDIETLSYDVLFETERKEYQHPLSSCHLRLEPHNTEDYGRVKVIGSVFENEDLL